MVLIRMRRCLAPWAFIFCTHGSYSSVVKIFIMMLLLHKNLPIMSFIMKQFSQQYFAGLHYNNKFLELKLMFRTGGS